MSNKQLQTLFQIIQTYVEWVMLDLEFVEIRVSFDRKKVVEIVTDALIVEELEGRKNIFEYVAFRLGYKFEQ